MSGTSVGEIGLDLVLNDKGYKKGLNSALNLAKKTAGLMAAAFSVKKIVSFAKECIDLGSDLEEVQNVVDVTFPSMSQKVDQFARKAAKSFGLSETMAKQYTGTFGSMAKAFGFTEKQAYDMSTTLTALSGDVASFYNLTNDEAFTKLKSVFTGETESLKSLGVVMTQSALDQYALANGFGKTTNAMSEAEKVALRYSFVQNQLAAASGDFARTSDGWANQVRILTLQFQSLKAAIGQGLINVLTPVIKVVNLFIGRLVTAANAFKAFTELLFGKKGESNTAISSAAADAGALSTGLGNAADNAGGLGQAAKKAAKEMRALMGFDQINKVSEPSDSDSGSGSGGSGSGGGVSDGSLNIGEGVDFGSVSEGETVLDKYADTVEKLKNLLSPTTEALKRLWNEGLAKLGEFGWQALKDFYDHFLKPVAEWQLGVGLPGFIDALNNGLMAVDWQSLNDALVKLWDALAPFAIHVGEGLLWCWENVFVPFGTWAAGTVLPKVIEAIATAFEILNEVIEIVSPAFQWLWDHLIKPIAEFTGQAFTNWLDNVNESLEILKNLIGDGKIVLDFVAEKTGKAWDDLKTWAGPKVKKVKRKLEVAARKAGEIWEDLKIWAKDKVTILEVVGHKAGEAWNDFKDWIFNRKTDLSVTAKKLGSWKDIQDWLSSRTADLSVTAIKTGEAWKDLKNWLSDRKSTLSVAVIKASEWVADAWAAATKKAETISRTLKQSVEKGTWVTDAWTAVKTAADTVKRYLKQSVEKGTWIGDAWTAVKTAAATVKRILEQTVKKGTWISDAWDAARAAGGTVKKTLQISVSWIGSKLAEAWKVITGRAKGGVFKAGVWHDVAAYAGGTANAPGGQLFIARESGPELVGRMPGGGTGVINNDQIVASVSNGVRNALASVLSRMHAPVLKYVAPDSTSSSANETEKAVMNILEARDARDREILSVLRQILEYISGLELTAEIDVNKLKQLIVSLINSHTRATGMCEIEV